MVEQLDLAGWRTARRARGEATRVARLVEDALGVVVTVRCGLASEPSPDALLVPATWSARTRGVATSAARPVVVPDGSTAHVVLDARSLPAAQLRPTERAWLVVAVRREGDGLAVVRGVLLRSLGRRPSWRLAPCLSEARRRPSAATTPMVAWTVRPAPDEPSARPSRWTVRPVAPADERTHDAIADRSDSHTAKYAQQSTVDSDGGEQLAQGAPEGEQP